MLTGTVLVRGGLPAMWSDLGSFESLESLDKEICELDRKLAHLRRIRDLILAGDDADIGELWLEDNETDGILRRNGIATIGQVRQTSDAAFLKMWRIGPQRLKTIRAVVDRHVREVARLRCVTPFERPGLHDNSAASERR